MELDRTKNALRNIIWGVVEKITLLLLPFITRTVLIKILGAEYLGLNTLFVSILQVLSVSELGFGSAIVFSMYKPIAQDDNKTLCALLNLYKKIYHYVGSAILVLGIAIIPFLHLFVKGDVPADVNLYSLYLIFLLNTVISYFLFAYKTALFSAFQRNDVQSKRNSLISFVSNSLQIILLLTLHNYYAYVLVIPLGTVLTNLVNAYYAKKMYPDIVCKGDISKEMKDGIKKRVIGLLSYKVYILICYSIGAIVISAYIGLKPLALYNNYSAIINIFYGFLDIVSTSLIAGIGNKMICESKEKIYVDFKNYLFVYGWISSFFVVLLASIFKNFMIIWLGNEFLLPSLTVVLLLLNFMIARVANNVIYTYRQAAGLWWEDRFNPIVQAIANISLCLFLVNKIGINGVIIATTFSSLCIGVPWGGLILFRYFFKRSILEYYKLIFFYMTVTLFACFVCYYLCNILIISNSLLALFMKIVITFWVSNIIFFTFYHKLKEFDYLKSKIIEVYQRFVLKYKTN